MTREDAVAEAAERRAEAGFTLVLYLVAALAIGVILMDVYIWRP